MMVNQARVAAALPGYELGDQLGAGAFGLVLAARHRQLDRPVAVKVVPAGPGSAAEARLLASLDHPHIVRVFDCVEAGELRLVVMELLGGGTLTRRRAGLTPQGVCAAGLAVAAALSCAHAAGVLHRDVKTDNMLFDAAGLLKVTDFGIAKIVEGSAATASAVVGTPAYMAPEQILGGRLSPATDLYALGVVLYQLLAGRPLFDPTLPVQALWQHHLNTTPAPPAGVPAPVAAVVLAALAKDPADRPASAHAFALNLAAAAADAYGPRWTARSGLLLRLDDEVRDAAGDHAPPPAPPTRHPPATGHGESRGAAPAPGKGGVAWAGQPTARPPADPGPPAPRPAPPPRRIGRRRGTLAAAVLLVLAAVAGTVLAVDAGSGGTATQTPGLATPPTPLPSLPPLLPTPLPLGTPLTGHTDWVSSVAFAPDGKTLASGSGGVKGDQSVRLWDVANPANPRQLGQPLTGHTGSVSSVAFAPDGKTLASGSYDHTVRLWDVANPATPRQIGQPLTGHTSTVSSVAFAPDGKTLASGSGDDTVRLWDLTDRDHPRQIGPPLTGHTDAVWSVAFAPDGKTLASGSGSGVLGSYDGAVRLWDVANPATPRQIGQPLTGHTDWVRSVAFAPDGATLASGSDDKSVRLWDVANPAAPRQIGPPLTGHTSWVSSVAFSPDGATLASGSDDRTVRLWAVR